MKYKFYTPPYVGIYDYRILIENNQILLGEIIFKLTFSNIFFQISSPRSLKGHLDHDIKYKDYINTKIIIKKLKEIMENKNE